MACTALLLSQEDGKQYKVKIISIPLKEGIQVDWFQCDDAWIPNGILNTNYLDQTETEFHSDIRREGFRKGTFQSGESTNPELNFEL